MTPTTSNEDSLAAYAASIETLKAAKVPASLGFNHLQVLNNFNASLQMLILLSEYEKDPVKGLIALKSFQVNAENAVALFDTIASELKKNDIIFDKTEPGYIWNNYR